VNENWADPNDVDRLWHDAEAYQVISLDPGGTTGWSIFSVHPIAMNGDPDIPPLINVEWWTAGEFTGNQDSQCDEIVEMLREWPYARLVTEDFKLRQLNAELDPVEINAILRHVMRPRYFVLQSASLAMGTLPDDRQKELGLWIPGKQHARDAVKHNVTFIKRRKAAEVAARRRIVPSP